MNSEICKICMGGHKPGTLVDGKCGPCAKKYPGVDSMKEWKEKKNPEAKEEERVINDKIDKIVERKLKEFGILADCPCGKSYFRKSPAQKSCGNCPKETD